MKKYLFLLLLFIVYLFLLIKTNTKSVINYNNVSNESIIYVDIYFKNGINSNNLINEFTAYKDDYLIKNISINNNNYNLNCSSINNCIKNIFNFNDDDFYNKYITNGFKINSLTIIADKNYIINYLKNRDYLYKIY